MNTHRTVACDCPSVFYLNLKTIGPLEKTRRDYGENKFQIRHNLIK